MAAAGRNGNGSVTIPMQERYRSSSAAKRGARPFCKTNIKRRGRRESQQGQGWPPGDRVHP